MTRTRTTYILLAVVTIAVGLAVHLRGTVLGPVLRDVAGDALWAAMIMWWVSAFAPSVRLAMRGMIAYTICLGVEVSQLYHAPTIDAVRATLPGRLVLGSGFDPRDLLAYAAGVIGTVLLDRWFVGGSSRKIGVSVFVLAAPFVVPAQAAPFRLSDKPVVTTGAMVSRDRTASGTFHALPDRNGFLLFSWPDVA